MQLWHSLGHHTPTHPSPPSPADPPTHTHTHTHRYRCVGETKRKRRICASASPPWPLRRSQSSLLTWWSRFRREGRVLSQYRGPPLTWRSYISSLAMESCDPNLGLFVVCPSVCPFVSLSVSLSACQLSVVSLSACQFSFLLLGFLTSRSLLGSLVCIIKDSEHSTLSAFICSLHVTTS